MDETVFKEYMQKRGYRINGVLATGVESEFPITVSVVSGRQWQFALTCTSFSWKGIDKELRRELKSIAQVQFINEAPVVTIPVNDDTYSQNFDQAVRTALGVLKRNNVQPVKTCVLCGKGDCDAMVVHGSLFQPVHNACCDSYMGNAIKEDENNRLNGNYLLGIIGAVLGAVVGAVPSILTIYYLSRVYAILFALIPLCISIGYKLFRGKRGKAAMVITVLLSVVDVYVIQIALLCIGLFVELGIPFADALSVEMQLLQSSEVWSDMTKDSMTCFVFVILGMMISWKYIANLDRTKAGTAALLLKTKVPYNEDQARLYDVPAQEEASVTSETGTTNYM